MAKNKYTIGCGDINPVINLIVEGSLGTQIVGEPVDLTGVTIYALHYNGKKENVTNKVRLSRSNWSDTEGNQSVDIGYKGRRITLTANVSEVMLDSISVKTPPTKTSYKVGETISATGLVLTATYTDGSSEDVTEGYTFTPVTMASDTTAMTISLEVDGITKTTTQVLTLVSLDSISVKTPPTVTSFAAGANIDLTGLVLTATYTDGSTADVTQGYTFSPTVMANDTTSVTISYTENGVTKTTTQAVSLLVTRKKVGGIIFYIDSTADGTYTFYNGEGTQVAAPTVGMDCTDWEYTVTGASKDKYYVVHNELYRKIWGGYGNLIGASGTAIGTGRSNTATAIGSVADEAGSIWETIRNMRTNAVGGCDDWFVGSKDELDALRTSGAGNSGTWFADDNIWSSSEYDASHSWMWIYTNNQWGRGLQAEKQYSEYLCGIRAF